MAICRALATEDSRRLFNAGLEQDAVYDGLNGVVLALFQLDRLRKIAHFAVDAGAKALLVELVEQVLELALASAHDGRVDGDALALAESENALDDLFGGLARDLASAIGTVRDADGGVEQAQVVVDFRDGAHGGAGAAAGGFLLDGDGGAESFDGIHVGALDLI